jgi:phosphohistidine phosphatase
MKTLLLMRHAKSSWKNKDLPEFDRPLNKRGEKDAPEMGKLLKKKNLVPSLIIASPAVRARMTAEAVKKKSGYEQEIVYLDKLYQAEVPAIIDALKEQPDGMETVMLIGHNPGLESVLQILTGKIESLPTASIANITLPIDHWSEISVETKGKLVKTWRSDN